ncbi:Myc-type, basic helix-loop-helix [Sesbania bispinosa]|nr:Myc-type, basic helix-loop-helix [Sesbania bispinosa]
MKQHSFCNSSSFYPSDQIAAEAPSHQDKALAALKNHKEAEKRRRERINSHLDKLRTLLPYRSDLLPDLIEILRSLNLKTLKAELATLGGRTRNVLVVAADKDHSIESIQFLPELFKSLLERSNSSERSKRRRVMDRNLMA